MATNIFDMLERYKSTGDAKFFKLANDGDSATVRILIDNTFDQLKSAPVEDLGVYMVHEVGAAYPRKSYLCTEKDDCKYCLEGNRAKLKIFLQLYDTKDNTVKIWERGSEDIERITKLIKRFGPLVGLEMIIERQGEARNMKTKYLWYPGAPDGKTLKDFPAKSKIVGNILAVARDGQEAVAEELPPSPAPRKRLSEDVPF